MSSTPTSVDAGVGIGEIFLDKYRVDAILGHGGMGVVALCTHLALNEQVAIKMLRQDVLDDADAVERFMREAQAAVKLKSEFVARVTDVGRSAANVPYMVMEYLEGHDLGQLLDERGSLALPWAVELTLQACEALCEAHSIGIVHRDIKPTNLFVTWRPDGSALIKVLDFGISKSPIISALRLTQTQSLLGTPAYMSPEQMRSARLVDARTDIWSLGTVLYELLEGRRPFEAESFSEMCVKVAVDPPEPMTSTPAELQQVVLRCLEKAPEQRYGSMAELAADLVMFSHDPHQAQVLVERMSRMLRRSQVIDWDPARNSMPMQARDVRSAERRAEQAVVLDPSLEAAALRDDSPPKVRVSGLARQASGPVARVSGAAIRASSSAEDASGPADRVSGAKLRAASSAEDVTGPADRVSGAKLRAASSAEDVSGPADRVSGAKLRAASSAENVSGAADRSSGAKLRAASLAEDGSGAGIRVSGAVARASGAMASVTGAAASVTGAAASVTGAADRATGAPAAAQVVPPWRTWRRALLVAAAFVAAGTLGGVVSLARDRDPADPSPASADPAKPPGQVPSGEGAPSVPAGPTATDSPPPVRSLPADHAGSAPAKPVADDNIRATTDPANDAGQQAPLPGDHAGSAPAKLVADDDVPTATDRARPQAGANDVGRQAGSGGHGSATSPASPRPDTAAAARSAPTDKDEAKDKDATKRGKPEAHPVCDPFDDPHKCPK